MYNKKSFHKDYLGLRVKLHFNPVDMNGERGLKFCEDYKVFAKLARESKIKSMSGCGKIWSGLVVLTKAL